MKRIAVILPVFLAISLLAFAQSQPPQREPERVWPARVSGPLYPGCDQGRQAHERPARLCAEDEQG